MVSLLAGIVGREGVVASIANNGLCAFGQATAQIAGEAEQINTLNERGLIEYSRGNIKIPDRDALKTCSCECYEVVRDFVDRIVKPGKGK